LSNMGSKDRLWQLEISTSIIKLINGDKKMKPAREFTEEEMKAIDDMVKKIGISGTPNYDFKCELKKVAINFGELSEHFK